MRPDPHPAHPTHLSFLAVDVGSTRTKLALAEGSRVARIGSFATGADWEDRFGAVIAARFPPESVEGIGIAAPARSFGDRLRSWWTEHLGPPPPTGAVDPATAPLAVDYRPPSALGADRIAGAVAAVAAWGAPVVVVDVGTAVTCDLVAGGPGGPRFAGGVIAAGPGAAYAGLIERVPHLGLARALPADGELPRVPTSTYDAVRVGALRGAAALVDGLVADYRARVGDAPVVVTGGLGPTVARHCAPGTVTAVDPDLTLRGIALSCSGELAELGGRTAGCRPGGRRR